MTTSYRTKETLSCFGMKAIGNHCVRHIIIEKQLTKMEALEMHPPKRKPPFSDLAIGSDPKERAQVSDIQITVEIDEGNAPKILRALLFPIRI